MRIKLKDIVIVKNEKTLLYNHRCMVGFNTHTKFYTLYDLETGEIRGQYNSIVVKSKNETIKILYNGRILYVIKKR